MARMPAPTVHELRAAFEAGHTVAEIATSFGCSQRNVRYLAVRYGVALPRAARRSTATRRLSDVDWLRSERAAGLSKSTIAAALGVRPAQVDAALVAAGLPIGPPPRVEGRLSDEGWLRTRFAGGGTAATIATELGCSTATVNAAAHRFEIARSDPRVKFANLQDRGWLVEQLKTRTFQQIADELGRTPSAVGQPKRRAGLSTQRGQSPLLDDRTWLHTPIRHRPTDPGRHRRASGMLDSDA
jgi:hypothetical protein